ncbi:sporulation delaying system autorepressor SdpR [Hymenobacter saemangeumensis]|uniref:Sporulation delaying system autorepressor SdpR n=1 Tax=Hymenobacter saemangeumensis TaxID=1084522 RepID=A0ABP8IFE3_9BACT
MNTLFKALNDPTRRAMLELLRQGPRTAGEIAEHFSFSKPTISHHLDLLRQADLVSSDKQGQYVTYTLNMTVMDELLGWLLQFKSDT